MKKKLVAATLLVAIMTSLCACGSNGVATGSKGDGVSITIFNSKMEVQEQFEQMAEEYSKNKGVNVEVYYSNDTVASHIATKYASNDLHTNQSYGSNGRKLWV